MNQLVPTLADRVPALIFAGGEKTTYRFFEFFTAYIRNSDTRRTYAIIQRRARAAGIAAKIGNNTFRATSVTAYLKNGGTFEKAAQMANHASRRARRNSMIGAPRN